MESSSRSTIFTRFKLSQYYRPDISGQRKLTQSLYEACSKKTTNLHRNSRNTIRSVKVRGAFYFTAYITLIIRHFFRLDFFSRFKYWGPYRLPIYIKFAVTIIKLKVTFSVQSNLDLFALFAKEGLNIIYFLTMNTFHGGMVSTHTFWVLTIVIFYLYLKARSNIQHVFILKKVRLE